MSNLEQWLAKGRQLQTELEEAARKASDAEEMCRRLNFKSTYLKDRIGSIHLAKQSFKRVLNGEDAESVIKEAHRQRMEMTEEKAELLRVAQQLHNNEKECKQASVDAAAARKAAEAAADQLEKHNAKLPADTIQQINETQKEAAQLNAELERLDAAIQRIESQPNEDEVALKKLAEAEAAYSRALVDAELGQTKADIERAKKLREQVEAAKVEASRSGADRQHKLDALSQRQAEARARLAELGDTTRAAVAASHELRLEQTRRAVRGAIEKHLLPSLAKHNAVCELLQNYKVDGRDYRSDFIRLDLVNRLLETLSLDDAYEIHAEALGAEYRKLTESLGLEAEAEKI